MITMLTARRLERAAHGQAPPISWRCNILLAGIPPRAGPYRAVAGEAAAAPCINTFPAISIIGRRDHFYDYSKGLRAVYANLTWLEHEGGHEAPTDEATNRLVAEAIWDALRGSSRAHTHHASSLTVR